MKKIIIFAILIATFISCTEGKEYNYTGVVVQKQIENATSGYRSSTPTRHFLILKEMKSGKFMRVNVIITQYYSAKKGDTLTFRISNFNMYLLGNTTDSFKNLYGQE